MRANNAALRRPAMFRLRLNEGSICERTARNVIFMRQASRAKKWSFILIRSAIAAARASLGFGPLNYSWNEKRGKHSLPHFHLHHRLHLFPFSCFDFSKRNLHKMFAQHKIFIPKSGKVFTRHAEESEICSAPLERWNTKTENEMTKSTTLVFIIPPDRFLRLFMNK